MRKVFLTICGMFYMYATFCQVEVTYHGDVGMGITPESKLHIKDDNTTIKLTNGYNMTWYISNLKKSPFNNSTNILAIGPDGNDPILEFKPKETYIHNKLIIGDRYYDNNPILRFGSNKYVQFTSNNNDKSGILFYEQGEITKNTVQFGAKIEYNESTDALVLGTFQDFVANDGLQIARVNGSVGINCDNDSWTYKLMVKGAAYTTSVWQTSDERFKENITDLLDPTDNLEALRGVTYTRNDSTKTFLFGKNYNPSQYYKGDSTTNDTITIDPPLPETNYGFIAQEVQEIYPDLVHSDAEGYLAINYTGFIPIIVEGFKKQQKTIKKQKRRINQLEDRLEEIEAMLQSYDDDEDNDDDDDDKNAEVSTNINETQNSNNKLYQNTPNPFKENTVIDFTISESAKQAMLCVYDLNGTQLKCYNINQTGDGEQEISAYELHAGIYIYALIVDGQMVESKQMVLTE